MNKKMRELLAKIKQLKADARAALDADEKDVAKANELLDQAEALEKEYQTEKRLIDAEKSSALKDAEENPLDGKVSGFKAIVNKLFKRKMSDAEKELLINSESSNGENYLVPEDVKLEINELRRQYKSARNIVDVETTDALSGSVNYEAGTPAGLVEFGDGDEIAEEDDVKFTIKTFAIKFFAKLIPLGRILLGAERSGLLKYLNKWFIKNAIITENAKIFAALKAGKENTAKPIVGWKALRSFINIDLDPDVLFDALIVTNQTGLDLLENEVDDDNQPVLKWDPVKSKYVFKGLLTVEVFGNKTLPDISEGHAPMFVGSTKSGCTFVEYEKMEMADSEHYMFNRNMKCLRVIEGFDVMNTDTEAYGYIDFSASVVG